MKRKNIIITGSAGFIGTALINWLYKKYSIIGIDRNEEDNVVDSRYTIIKGDICDSKTLDKIRDDIDIYAVIHLAANPGVRDSHERFEQVCRDNILGTQKIIDKCISDWKPKRLLLASSSSVYGDIGKDGHALEETDGVSPRSPYAMSKVAGESLVITYKNCGMFKCLETIDHKFGFEGEYDEIKAISMRFFTVYGPNQRNELAIRAFTDWILRDEPIKLYGDGTQVRDFTHIDDICSGIQALLEEEKLHWIIYNIGSGNSISINEIIHKIATYLNKPVTINYEPRNRYDVDATRADITNISGDTEWKPKIDFDEGLKGQIEWQKKKYEEEMS